MILWYVRDTPVPSDTHTANPNFHKINDIKSMILFPKVENVGFLVCCCCYGTGRGVWIHHKNWSSKSAYLRELARLHNKTKTNEQFVSSSEIEPIKSGECWKKCRNLMVFHGFWWSGLPGGLADLRNFRGTVREDSRQISEVECLNFQKNKKKW